MAKYRLTGPDGKVYTVNAPDNASNEDLVNFVKQQSGVPGIGLGGTQDPAGATQNDLLNASSQYAAGGQPAPEHVPHAARAEAHPYMDDQGITYNSDGVAQPYQVKPGGSRDDFGRMITHAIHHGFAAGYDEELASGAKALGQYVRGEKLSFNEAYDQNLAAYRDQAKALREAYPKTSLGTTIAAGAMVPLGSLGLAGKGGGALKNIWTGAKVGGAYGALSGFGDGEGGFANRLDSARVGAEWGAGLGAGLGVVAPVVAKGIMDYALPAARAVGRAPGQVVSKIADQFGGLPQSVQKVVNDPRNAALARLSVIAERSAKEATPGGLGQPGDPRGMTGAHIIGKLGSFGSNTIAPFRDDPC